jgi:hypothetical protein
MCVTESRASRTARKLSARASLHWTRSPEVGAHGTGNPPQTVPVSLQQTSAGNPGNGKGATQASPFATLHGAQAQLVSELVTQAPLQQLWPKLGGKPPGGTQAGPLPHRHWPALHCSPVAHALPQSPQLAALA